MIFKARLFLCLTVLMAAQSAMAVPFALSRSALPSSKNSLKHSVAFTENWQRHPTPQTIIKQMIENLGAPGMITNYAPYLTECLKLTPEMMGIVGANNPATFKPTTPEPGEAFARWQLSCAQKMITAHRDFLMKANNYTFKPPLWSDLSSDDQKRTLEAIVVQVIGDDDVLLDLQLQTVPGDLVTRLQEQINQDIADKSTSYPFVMGMREIQKMHPLEAGLLARYLLYFLDWSRY